MKSKKRAVVFTSILLLSSVIISSPQTVSANSASPKKNTVIEQKTKGTVKKGWFKKGKYRYYRLKNGELCKSKIIKIGKHYYSFDKKGRMRKGLVKLGTDYSGYFSYKTGHFIYYVMDLKVTRVFKDQAVGKSKEGWLYEVPFDKKIKWKDRSGKNVKKPVISKNEKIRVYFKGQILESSPAQFMKIVKVRIK